MANRAMANRAMAGGTTAWSLAAVAMVLAAWSAHLTGAGDGAEVAHPTSGVQSAPPVDRVGFPAGYRDYAVLRTANITQQGRLGTIYGNAAAASIDKLGALPYPNGSVVVMEWATPRTAADGTPLTGAGGIWAKGEVVRIDVMRREAGYGAAYGDKRAGEWEFASYTPDGKPFAPAIDAAACAACHTKPGVARDFVFRGRFPALDGK